LHGKVNPDGSQTTFWFEYGTSSNLGSVTSFQTTSNDNTSLTISVPLSNLQPATKYYFRLNAQNQFGTVNGEMLNFTTAGPATAVAPAVATSLVTAITSSSAKLNATVTPNGAETTYWFEYSTNATISNGILTTPEQSLNGDSLLANISTTINNLSANTNYYIRIVAKNQYGTVRGDIKSFTSKK
jgi:phosphodiesterase/alkaline phosphatase D-like protein